MSAKFALPSGKPLIDKVAIITGASRGIGRDIALRLAALGCNIVVAAKSEREEPNLPGTIYTVAKEVEALGSHALPFKLDVRDDSSVEAMVQATIAKFGRVDYLINNAGALWWKNVTDTPMKRYDLINGINSRGTFSCTHAVLPHMLKQRYGRIINMSPPIELDLLPGKVAYCISKFGMTLLAHGLAEEVKGTGVAINALWPATMIESFATINHNLGDRTLWRKPEILSDCVVNLLVNEPDTFSGHALIDDDYLASRGVMDFTRYRCDPNVEVRYSLFYCQSQMSYFIRGKLTAIRQQPPRLTNAGWSAVGNVGLIADVKKRSIAKL